MEIQRLDFVKITPVPAGKYMVIISDYPKDKNEQFLDQNNIPLRKFWRRKRIFKGFKNAQKHFDKLKNQAWSKFFVDNNIIHQN